MVDLKTPLSDPNIDQIGMVVPDAAAAAEQMHQVLGIGPFRVIDWPIEGVDPQATYHGEPGDFRIRVAFAQVGPIGIELVQSLEGDNIWADFLASHGPGLHHFRITVPDFDETVASLEAAGIEKISSGTGFHVGSRWAYFDTSRLLDGLIVEIRSKLDPKGESDWAVEGEQIG
jgi:hypothetical protein